MKKALSFLLAFAIVLALLPAGVIRASAADGVYVDGDDTYTYAILGTNAVIKKYESKNGYKDLVIPSTLGGAPVVFIGMPGGDGMAPFQNCTGLTSVTIPNTVTQIRSGSFQNCSSLASVTINGPVTLIGSYAFQNCKALSSIILPSSVTTIATSAFEGSGLTTISIGNKVASIASLAFAKCASLTAITFPNGNANYSSNGGVLFDKAETILIQCPSGKSGAYTIPGTVITINDNAFEACTKLTSVTIPNSVTKAGLRAFKDCTGLTTVNIGSGLVTNAVSFWSTGFENCVSLTAINIDTNNPDYMDVNGVVFNKQSLLLPQQAVIYKYPQGKTATSYSILNPTYSIGAAAFSGSTNLTSIVTEDQLKSISDEAFRGCTGLTQFNIPATMMAIGRGTFTGCSQLAQITVDPGNPNFSSDTAGVLFDFNKTLLIQYPSGKSGSYEIPSTVTTLELYAFDSCAGITTVEIPSSVTLIRRDAFRDCNALTQINVAAGNTNYTSDNGVLYNNAMTNLIKCPAGKSGDFAIPNGVTSIGVHDEGTDKTTYAFENCTELTSITIPDSVVTIAISSFENCTGLTEITIPASVTTIDRAAFKGCTELSAVYFLGNAPTFALALKSCDIFDNNAAGRMLYYLDGKTGFTNNPWRGYPIEVLVNITFDANGGTGGTGPTAMSPGDPLTAPAVAKDGYTLTGWLPALPDPLSVPGVNTTYVAQWQASALAVTVTMVGNEFVVNLNGWTASNKYQIWAYEQVTSDDLLNITSNAQANQWILYQGYAAVGAGNIQQDGSANFIIPTFASPTENYVIAVRVADAGNNFVKEVRDAYTPESVQEVVITKVLVDGAVTTGYELRAIKGGAQALIKVIGNNVPDISYSAKLLSGPTATDLTVSNTNEVLWDISALEPGIYVIELTATNGDTTATQTITFELYSLASNIAYGSIDKMTLTPGVGTVGITPTFANGTFSYRVREPGRAAIYRSVEYTTEQSIPAYGITAPGVYHVAGYVTRAGIIGTENGSFDDGIIKTLVIPREGGGSVGMTFTANQTLPDVAKGTAITFTAEATGLPGAVQYSFWRYDATGYVLVKDWSTSPTLSWTPARVGEYTLQVRAKGAGAGSYEVNRSLTVNITDNVEAKANISSITLNTGDLTLAQAKKPIMLKANATASNGDDLLYKFYVYDDDMKNQQLKGYSIDQNCVWTPREAGQTYTISVLVKNQTSFGKYDAIESFDVTVD